MFKITFLHDEHIFLIQISFYDLEYEPRVQENTCERPWNYTARARAQNSYFSLLFVLDVVWGPSRAPSLVDPLYSRQVQRGA